MNSNLKRVLSFMLALTMAILCLPMAGIEAFAANISNGETDLTAVTCFYAQTGQNYPKRQSSAASTFSTSITDDEGKGICMLFVPSSSFNVFNYGVGDSLSDSGIRKSNTNKNMWVYCIQHHVSANDGLGYTAQNADINSFWNSLSTTARYGIEIALICGFPQSNLGYAGGDAYAATQALIWEFQYNGIRTIKFTNGKMDGTQLNATGYGNVFGNSTTTAAYNALVSKINAYLTEPVLSGTSYSASTNTATLKWNRTNNRYEATITDSKNVISNYISSGSSGDISWTVSGNKIVLYTTNKNADNVTLSINHKEVNAISASDQPLLVLNHSSQQKCIAGPGRTDPIPLIIKATVEDTGAMNIKKTSEDGKVSGITFKITGPDSYSETKTTDANGNIALTNLLPGNYTITETAPNKYVQPESQVITVQSGKTATVTFNNKLKKWKVTVTKRDAETGATAQGDATLQGAVYGLYNSNGLVAQYTTNASGQFETSYYACGTDYYFQEITAPKGYNLDTTKYNVSANPASFTNEKNTLPGMTANDSIIKGQITLEKWAKRGNESEPEDGAKFQVYLSSAGSYANAKASERDVITTDENGVATTKLLPYGIYTVHQISGWEGYMLSSDFECSINVNGEVENKNTNGQRNTLVNERFESAVMVYKVDAETNQRIPVRGAEFEIYDADQNLISMRGYNPATGGIGKISKFTTDTEGKVMLPEYLEYGNYFLKEVTAPEGYVLDSAMIPFSITEDNSVAEVIDGVSYDYVINVTKENTAQKGIIKVYKEGLAFASVTQEDDSTYTPVYAMKGLKNAVFTVTAAEDIYTPDGTKRASEGDVVSTITTGTDGNGQSDALYLGKYIVTETSAPEGYIIDATPHEAELIYAGQEIEITETQMAAVNERQKVEFNLLKTMQNDDTFGIGTNGEVANVTFGIYAKEDLVAYDDSVIPAGGLIEVINVSADGRATVTKDLPIGTYYFKEISTDAHYVLNNDEFEVKFEYQGQDVQKVVVFANNGEEINNDLIYRTITFNKVNEDGEPLSGVVFGLYAADDKAFENPILTATTNDEGIAVFENVPYGKWVVREISTLEGYVLDETAYPYTIEEANVIEDQLVVNEYLRVSLVKANAENYQELLSEAEFSIYKDTNDNGKLDKNDEFIGLMTESEFDPGHYEIMGLGYGLYFMKETKAPYGFNADPTVYQFVIEATTKSFSIINNENANMFTDTPIRGGVAVTKYDAEYPDHKLSGARFEVYEAILNEETGEYTPGKYINYLREVAEGEYELREILMGHYFIRETVAPEGFLLDDTFYPFEIVEQDVMVNISNDLEFKGFYNEPIKAPVVITKRDIVDGTPIPNCGFRIKDEDGNVVAEGYTDENGEFTVELRYGKYTYEEFDAPDGYLLSDEIGTFEILENGEIVRCEMSDERVPVTGDASTILPFAGIGIAAAAILVLIRKREDKIETSENS